MEKINIDTLLFSGGGLKCYTILGSLKYLFDNNIINDNFKDIKDIFYVSGSAIFTLPILIGYSIEATIQIFKSINYSIIFDINSINLQSLLSSYGLKDISTFYFVPETILERIGLNKDITLKGLYDLNKINVHFKVMNITKDRVEYLNHINNPDIELKKAILMTSCVPIIFNPFKYKDSLYIDGGLMGNFPQEMISKYPNHIGIDIISTKATLTDNEYNKCIPSNNFKDLKEYLQYLYDLYGTIYNTQESSRHIRILINGCGVDFKSLEKKLNNMYEEGYNQSKEHYKDFSISD